MPFIIENGRYPTRYRGWGLCGPTWVDSIEDAIQYARRKDAESQHAEDEDACFIREVDAATGLVVSDGPYGVMQLGGGAFWAVFRCGNDGGGITELFQIANGVPESEREWMALVCAAALNRVLPSMQSMRDRHNSMLAALLERFIPGNHVTVELHPQGSVQAVVHEMTATNLTPTEVLHLFSEFVHRNATQWRTGGVDHHHPIWGLVATILDGKLPITEGVDWAFIQPENRLSIEALRSARGRIESVDGQ